MARLAVILDLPEVDPTRIDSHDAADLVLGWRPLSGSYVSAEWTDAPAPEISQLIADTLTGVPLHASPFDIAELVLQAVASAGFRIVPNGSDS